MKRDSATVGRQTSRNFVGKGLGAPRLSGIESLERRLLLSASPTDDSTAAAAAQPLMGADVGAIHASIPKGVGFTPAQIATAYGVNKLTLNGQGQTIALVDAYDDPGFVDSTAAGFATSDLGVFDTAAGLASPPSFEKMSQTGSLTKLPTTGPAGNGWQGEEALDVEWAHAMAPDANIILVEANSQSSADLSAAAKEAASLPGVSVVSMSFTIFDTEEDPSESTYDSDFVTPAGHQGVTFIASAGDDGQVSYPASSPNVVGVGGTSLTVNGSSGYVSESTWNDGKDPLTNQYESTGGGPSVYESEPSFQQSVQTSGKRETPDVSFLADPNTGVAVYDSYYSGGWTEVGGTSLSAPCWAGLMALVDQQRVADGGTTLDGATQTLPALYKLSSSDFHDITTGNNGTYSAKVGYDEVTGLGTPIANLLVPALADTGMAANPPAVSGPATASVVAGGVLDFTGSNAISVTDTAGGTDVATLSVTAGTLMVTASGATVTGNGTAAVTITGTLAEVNAALGTLAYTAPSTGTTATLSVSVTDGSLTSTTLNTVITLTSPAPVLSGPTSTSVEHGASLAFAGTTAITLVDPSSNSATESLTLSVISGTLTVTGNGATVTGSGTSSMTISGTLSEVNAALTTLVYKAPATGTSDTLTVSDSDGPLSSNTLSVAIGLSNVPLIVNGPTTASVPHAGILSFGGSSLISISDASGDAETVTLSVVDGKLSVTPGAASVNGNNSSSITVSGTLAQVNTALSSLVYTAPNLGATDTLTVAASNIAAVSNTLAVAITLTDVAPVVSGPTTASVAQLGTHAFSGSGAITISDLDDSGGIETVTLNVTVGTFSFTLGGSSIVNGGSGTNSVELSGTIAQLNATLATLAYTAPATGSLATLTVSANDGSLNSNTLTTVITLIDIAPVVTGPTGATAVYSTPFALSGADAIAVSDPAGGASISVSLNVTGGTLTLTTSGLSTSSGVNTNAVTISGTVAEVNAALATLVYNPPATGTTNTLTVSAKDGTVSSNVLTVVIALAHAPPTVSGPSTATIAHAGELAFTSANLITVTDPGSGAVSAAITVTSGIVTVSTSGIAINGGANGSSAVTFSGTLAEINAALATLVYTAPISGATATLSVTATDSAVSSNPLQTVITLTDAAPVVTSPATLSVSHDAAIAVAGANGFVISDIDSGSSTESIALSATAGVLALSTSGVTVTSGANDSRAMTLSGTLAELNAALSTLVYTAPATGVSATLTATANDGALASPTATITIALTAAAPVVSGPTAASVVHGGVESFSGANAISVSDIEVGASVESVAISVTSGALTLSTSGVTVSSGAVGSSALAISGSIAHINAALATLVYTAPISGATATLTVTASDVDDLSGTLNMFITLNDAAPVVVGPTTATIEYSTPFAFTGGSLITVSDVDGGNNPESVLLNVTSGTLSVDTSAGGATGSGSGTQNILIDGTLAQINAALATLIYTAPAVGASATLLVEASDGTLSGSLSVAISFTSVSVVVNGPATASVPHLGTLAFGGSSAITFSDTSNGSDSVALSVTSGMLTLTTSGVTVSSGASGTGAITISGSVASLNAALATLAYTAPISGSSAVLSVTANDGPINSNTLSTVISLTDIAPVVAGPTTASIAHAGELAFSGTNLISVSDVDANGGAESISLSLSSGTLALSTSGVTISGGASGSSSLTIEGTLAELNAALATLVVTAPATGASATLTATANDAVVASNTLSTLITLTDAAPAVAGPAAVSVAHAAVFTFGGTNSISVSDIDDGGSVESVALSVSNGSLTLTTSGTTITSGKNGSGAVTISGTLVQLNAALSTLAYTAPVSGASATLTLTANDGELASAALVTSITLEDVAPVVAGPVTASDSFSEALAFTGANAITFSDVDASGAESVALSVSSGVLTVPAGGGVTISGSGTGSVTISGSLAEVNSALATLTYTAPSSGTSATLTTTANDGTLASNTLSTTIALSKQLVALSGPTAIVVAQSSELAFSGVNAIAVADAAGSTESVALSVTSGKLTLTTSGVSVSSGASGSSAVTISGSLSNVNAALATLTYTAPTTGSSATLTVTANDGSGPVASLPVSIQLAPLTVALRGPGTIVAPLGATIALNHTSLITLSNSAGSSAAPSGILETVSLTAGTGTLTVNLTGGITLLAGSSGSDALTIAGNATQINAALASLTYQAPSSGSADSLTITANYGATMVKLTVNVELTPAGSALQNPTNPLDVNGDGVINPFDVLEVIFDLQTTGTLTGFPDVEGLGSVTPFDVDAVIGFLQNLTLEQTTAGSAAIPAVESVATSPIVDSSTALLSPVSSLPAAPAVEPAIVVNAPAPTAPIVTFVPSTAVPTSTPTPITTAAPLAAAIVAAFDGSSAKAAAADDSRLGRADANDLPLASSDSGLAVSGSKPATPQAAVDSVLADSSFDLNDG